MFVVLVLCLLGMAMGFAPLNTGRGTWDVRTGALSVSPIMTMQGADFSSIGRLGLRLRGSGVYSVATMRVHHVAIASCLQVGTGD